MAKQSKEYYKKYCEENKERLKEKDLNYYWNNREKCLAYDAAWAAEHKAEISERMKKYYRANKEEKLAKDKEYRKTHAAELKLKRQEKMRNNPIHRLRVNLRNRLNAAVRNKQKAGSAVGDLGCSMDEFVKYIENKWQAGMTWDNWGMKGWHFDHIKPLISFDLTNREQFLEACHYTNIQPMWYLDNLSKGSR